MISGNSTGPGVDRLAGQVEVLADVTDIYGDHTVSCEVIAPFHAIRKHGPGKGHRSCGDEILAEGRLCQGGLQLLQRMFKNQCVLDRQITVNTALKGCDVTHHKVAFKSMPATGRGHGSQGTAVGKDFTDTLRSPKQKREFGQR